MDIKEFAEAYRLRVKNNGVEGLIHGKYGELADMRDAGRFRLRLLAVPRAADMDRKLRSRRKAALAAGLEMRSQGEAESIFFFNPTDPTQVQLVVKLEQPSHQAAREGTRGARQESCKGLPSVKRH